MITAEEINTRIAQAVKQSGKTGAQIAEEAGVSINAVNRSCYKRIVPRADTLEALCRALHLSADWVLGLSDYPGDSTICSAALEKYGFEHQLTLLFEEMSELQNALCKERRGRDSREHIAEEIADVEIMLEQMKLHYAIHEEVGRKRREKLLRLVERMGSDGLRT